MMGVDDVFVRFPRLATSRLILRQIEARDAGAIFATFADPETIAFYGEEAHRSLEDAREHVRAGGMVRAARGHPLGHHAAG